MKKGSALIALLVGMVILLILYAIDFRAIFGTGRLPAAPEEVPWRQEHRLAGPDQHIKLPSPPKPAIDENFTILAPVTRNDAPRGDITIDFTDMGEITGTWSCQYQHETRHYAFDANFAGNIDITKKFIDESGTDKSKLFFIAKGIYTKKFAAPHTVNPSAETGTIYVTGFLDKNYQAQGAITITTDQTWSAVYPFTSQEYDQ